MEAFTKAAVTVSLRGALDMTARERLKRQLAKAESADEAFVDLSDVTYAGTTLINALLSLRKRMRKRGGEGAIHLLGSSPQIRRIFTITSLDRVFDVR